MGSPRRVRIDGKLRRLQMRDLTAADTEQMIGEVLRADLVEQFHRTSEADFAYALSGVGRFRVNVFRSRGSVWSGLPAGQHRRDPAQRPPAPAGPGVAGDGAARPGARHGPHRLGQDLRRLGLVA